MPYKDKHLGKIKKKEYYLKVTKNKVLDPEVKLKQLVRSRELDLVRRYKRKLEAINLHGNKCADCNSSYHPSCYDFHHLDPAQKDYNPCSVLSSKEKFFKEVSKCVILCANCHRVRHSLYDTTVE
jgi:hypothetical protein